ncbi:hypothetical protein GF319_05535 [Candidatus Bathyarchaeota archaeon]|nr:hypothetical protein [Candidatus Bathyarchaeota archaeon]
MSEYMESAIEKLEKIADKVEDEEIKQRIIKVNETLSQNRKKIWLRTKTGKPMAEGILKYSDNLVISINDQSEIEEPLAELEAKVKEIEEESRRRSMVVT